MFDNKDELMMFFYGLLDMDTLVLANQQKLTSALCRHWKLSRRFTKIDGRYGRIVRKS